MLNILVKVIESLDAVLLLHLPALGKLLLLLFIKRLLLLGQRPFIIFLILFVLFVFFVRLLVALLLVRLLFLLFRMHGQLTFLCIVIHSLYRHCFLPVSPARLILFFAKVSTAKVLLLLLRMALRLLMGGFFLGLETFNLCEVFLDAGKAVVMCRRRLLSVVTSGLMPHDGLMPGDGLIMVLRLGYFLGPVMVTAGVLVILLTLVRPGAR